MFLLETAYVAVLTDDVFGAPSCIHLSFATSEEFIKKKRLKESQMLLQS